MSMMNDSHDSSIRSNLRRLLMPWGFALVLPVPVLLTSADSNGADVGTLYLALGGAWLGTEAVRPCNEPTHGRGLAHQDFRPRDLPPRLR